MIKLLKQLPGFVATLALFQTMKLVLERNLLKAGKVPCMFFNNSYRKQGNKLRRLFQYAWPCLLPKQCVVSISFSFTSEFLDVHSHEVSLSLQ